MSTSLSEAETKRRLMFYQRGLSDIDLAAEFEIKPTNVAAWRKGLGLPANRHPVQVDRVDHRRRERLYAKVLSDEEIGMAEGVSKATIRLWRLSRNLPSHKLRTRVDAARSQEGATRMLLYQLGWTDCRIARERGVTSMAVFDWRRRRGYPANMYCGRRLTAETELADLAARVKRAVGRGLASDIAEETVADLCLALLDGTLDLAAVEKEARRFGNRTLERFASRFGPQSVDEEIGADGFTLLDTMADDSQSTWLEEMGATVW